MTASFLVLPNRIVGAMVYLFAIYLNTFLPFGKVKHFYFE